jgi:hypothetical protein
VSRWLKEWVSEKGFAESHANAVDSEGLRALKKIVLKSLGFRTTTAVTRNYTYPDVVGEFRDRRNLASHDSA